MVKQQVNIRQLNNTLDEISALLLKLEDMQSIEDKKVVTTLASLLENIRFPASVNKQKNKLIKKLSKASDKYSDNLVDDVQSLLSATINQQTVNQHEKVKSGLLSKLFSSKDNTDKNNEEKITGYDVVSIDTDDSISINPDTKNTSFSSHPATHHHKDNAATSEPHARAILIRLLQQLTIPSELHEQVESLKHRIEDESSVTNWKLLLNDIALFINTLRNQMQEEKQEFETFLQEITGRLQEMDNFLSIENISINEADQASETLDAVVNAQVQDIHADMSSADDLNDLKTKVEKRLNIVSDHIREYRISEQQRYSSAQQNVESMQSRLQQLEQESGKLRTLIIEKNKEATFDALTKIPNRLAYEKKALEELARCKRFATPLSMAVWDIDFFKDINDTYGHKVGDKVLMAVAQLLEERMRETDFIARYGGEEFVMFLPGTTDQNALVLTEALREKIAACKFNHQGQITRITMSCGITHYIENDDQESMFERADKALYAAKDNGRNQCMTASSLSELQKS